MLRNTFRVTRRASLASAGKICSRASTLRARHASSQTGGDQTANNEAKNQQSEGKSEEKPKKKKTMAELDEELRLKLEGMSGEGGAAGLEYEDGKAVSMKRGVKNNMFRYI
ncbi:MAG: hypothetical protein FRX48_06815 [Lasallia pustulata]|uniref:Uncharacterized protein n=1 Tax=Lasallia pustulata TaxID=136370 RepID=A0A1W5D8N0_9LECA|nr:MAG: hypothetical protein FRX48_06815 [Lasallia pustulata]SLM39476.1 hypothetical protein LPUS_10026 [Lasallia pustulata]